MKDDLNNKIRTAHITAFLPHYHEKWGGAEQAAYETLKLLKKKGEDPLVITTRIKDDKKEFRIKEIRILEDYLGRLGELAKLAVPFDLISFFSIRKVLKQEKPDVVHLHWFNKISLSAILAPKSLGIPVVYSIYDYWPFCPTQILRLPDGSECTKYHGMRCRSCLRDRKFSLSQTFFAIFRRVIFDFFLKKVDQFIVLSEHSASVLRRYGVHPEKVQTVVLTPGMINQSSAKEKKENAQKGAILFIGWMEPHKGVHIIVQAMPQILKQIPEAKLYIMGPDSNKKYKEEMSRFIASHKLTDRVSFLGKMIGLEKKKYFDQASAVVIPEQWVNMSPVLVMECMAEGKPIVASRIGGIPEFIADNKTGLLAEAKDPSDFADKIIHMLRNKPMSNKMALGGKARFKKIFDEKNIYQKTIMIYRRLASR